MPQMHRFVYDFYSHYVESLRAQREVWLTVARITYVLCPVYTTPEEFENGGFILKTRQVFSVHTTSEEYKKATITANLICVRGKFGQGDRMIIVVFSFSESSVFQMFSSGARRGFEKVCFRDGLVWTVVLTEEMKLCFQTSPAYCGRCFSLN